LLGDFRAVPNSESDKGCPVCGYPNFREFHPEGGSTYDICPSCAFESGVDGIGRDRDERNRAFRQRWLDGGARWWSSARSPEVGWNALEQLRAAGLLDDEPPEKDDEP
jgi:hypothetical protein